MRKEVIFAIFAGIVFGLVIAFGVWRTNSALKSKEANSTQAEASSPQGQTTDKTPKEQLTLSLAKPQDYDVITQNPVEISGVTKPNSWVVISGEDDDYLTKSDSTGAFSENVTLSAGTNLVKVFAIDDAGKSVNQEINLVYSSEFAKDAGLNQ